MPSRPALRATHVQAHAVWQSHKPHALPLTVATQLSVSRLSQLSAQCRGWKGPLSAAVYVPLLEEEPRLPPSADHAKQQVAPTAAPQTAAGTVGRRRGAASSRRLQSMPGRMHRQTFAAAAAAAAAAASGGKGVSSSSSSSSSAGNGSMRPMSFMSAPAWQEKVPGSGLRLSKHSVELLKLAEQVGGAHPLQRCLQFLEAGRTPVSRVRP